MGLASSSNKALDLAQGKYIIRLDADDYFLDEKVLSKMLKHMEKNDLDILYPDNMKGKNLQKGNEQHHVGGTLFRKRALEYLRFTDGLRHFEGLDLYKRAIDHKLKIGYFESPTFFYRQHSNSMSKSKDIERQKIKEKLDNGQTGEIGRAHV